MQSRFRSIAAVLVGSLMLAGCGGDDATGPGGDPLGTFSATFSGAVTGSTTGMATFGVSDGMLVIMMSNATNTRVIQVVGESTGRIGTGAHTVGDGVSTDLSSSFVADSDVDNGFFSTGGSVTITKSSTSELNGTFTMTLTNFGETQSVTISGNFKAKCPGGSCS